MQHHIAGSHRHRGTSLVRCNLLRTVLGFASVSASAAEGWQLESRDKRTGSSDATGLATYRWPVLWRKIAHGSICATRPSSSSAR